MKKRKIAVFTGNRAEYGLQFPVLRAIDKHPDLTYRLIVSGAHLDTNFGRTLREIEEDGFRIDKEIKIETDSETLFSSAQAIGSGIKEISKALEEISPDIMVVYADRFEGFSAVVASTQMNIPTAHIEGGDLTEGGALDDSIRHAMTKLSHIHFTTNKQATNRILGMGEEPWRVHTVGFPAIDLILENNYAFPSELKERLNIDLNKPIIIFTQHSVTTQFDKAKNQILPSLEVLKELADKNFQIIITYPNNDAGGKQIIKSINNFFKKDISNIQIHISLGRYLYHGLLALAKLENSKVVCVGNSSSGIKETPAFSCPTVNIGSRQKGRLRGENVIDVPYEKSKIIEAINLSLTDSFKKKCQSTTNPYWISEAGPKIADILSKTKINQKLITKQMTLNGLEKDGWFK
tara:strand:+ start:2657 stop:3874 length:1218 start_codon:yes stop_codon:yes gene_type:complete